MKANKKFSRACKGILLSSVMFCSLHSNAQYGRAVLADPALGVIKLTDMSGYQVDQSFVQPNQVIKLSIPVINNNHGKPLPAGSCKIKIGLGSKLTLDPAYDYNTNGMSRYFTWTSSVNGGQVMLTGELVAALPANVSSIDVAVRVKGSVLGKSAITANFLVTNHNNLIIVSDEDGANNASFLQYTVTDKPAPVSTTTISTIVKEGGCSLNVSFSTDQEINLARYEVEVSKDGVTYEKISTVRAAGNLSYSSLFQLPDAMQVQQLFVRIKTVMKNGAAVYSLAKNVNGVCKVIPVKLGLYPNPVSGISKVTITAGEGFFNGKYRLKMTDISGKAVAEKDITANGVQNFVFDFGNIAAGKYLILVTDAADNAKLGLLQFEKL